jgi:hypothetical protein
MEHLELLKADFKGRISFRQRRPGMIQVLAPLFHEDGDMVDIFIDTPPGQSNPKTLRVSDHGMTLMRLSYVFDIETTAKRKILSRILLENGIEDDNGRFYIETTPELLYPSLLQFAQTVAKVSNMQAFKREVIQSLFYETLDDFVSTSLAKFQPSHNYIPIATRDDLEVDWRFQVSPRSIFLYGVKDTSKARLAALACREFQLKGIPFRSVIVHDDFENGLSKKDQARITNVADKQFTSFQDFQSNAEQFFSREAESSLVH